MTKLSANFAGQAFSAQAFSAQAFSAQAFSPQAFSAQAFSAQAFSADVFAGQAFSAQAFSGQAFSAQAFSGQAFSAQAFSAQAFSGQAFSARRSPRRRSAARRSAARHSRPGRSAARRSRPQAFSSAQVQSVIAVGAQTGNNAEHLVANTWNNTGNFYVRVSGANGDFDLDHPFTLQITQTGTTCAGVHDDRLARPRTATETGIKTVILTDSSRLPRGRRPT